MNKLRDEKAAEAWAAVVASDSELTEQGWFYYGFALGWEASKQHGSTDPCAKQGREP